MAVAVGVALTAAACAQSGATVDEESLAAAQALWNESRPDVYVVWYEGDVDGRERSERVLADRHLVVVGNDHRFAIDNLFEELSSRLARGESVRATFDEELGYPTEIDTDGLDVASKLFDGSSRVNGCEDATPGGPTDVGSEASERVLNAELYSRWHNEAGCPVRTDVITTIAGAAHCNWEDLEYLIIGDPIGTAITDETALNYVRDVDDLLGGFDHIDRSRTLDVDQLAAAVIDTGYRHDDSSLWLDPANPEVIYRISGDVAEEFILDADQQILCA